MAGELSRLWKSPALREVLDGPPASLETGERVRTERQGLCVGFSNLLRRIGQPFRRIKPASVLCLQRQCSVPSLRELKTVFLISVVPKLPGREGHSIFFSVSSFNYIPHRRILQILVAEAGHVFSCWC